VSGPSEDPWKAPPPDLRSPSPAASDEVEDPVTLRRLLEATLLLESNLRLGDLLSHIVTEARSLAGARYGALAVLDPTGREVVEFFVAGLDPEVQAHLAQGPLPTGRGVLGVLIDDPRPIRIRAIGEHPASTGFPPGHPVMHSFLGTPIKVRDQVYGNLYLTDKVDADEFTHEDQAVIEALSVAAGIAVENARLHQRAGEMAVYEERDRLARDLHDGVIQRLFAIGLSLQGLTISQTGRSVAADIATVVEDIDETIRQVRATIFELGRAGRGQGIRTAVLDLVDELQPVLGFAVPVDIIGPIEAAVSDEVADQLLATLREALTNVGKHARATEASVTMSLVGGDCRLEVRDNGRGIGDGPTRTGGLGLKNMHSRAEELGGRFGVHRAPRGGTVVLWQVPAHTGDVADGPQRPGTDDRVPRLET